MDREPKALKDACKRVADVATLVEVAKGHLDEGRFEDTVAYLQLI